MPTRQNVWLLLLEYHFSLPVPVKTSTILSGAGDEDALQVLQLKEFVELYICLLSLRILQEL